MNKKVKKSPRKLEIHRDTLRLLEPEALELAQGELGEGRSCSIKTSHGEPCDY